MIILPKPVNTALTLLETAGCEAFLVGGSVRDYVRGISHPQDWDITTNALPEQVKEIFCGYHVIETGLKHGTVTVVIGGEPLEITTYRIDGKYTDHRRPETVTFTRSLEEDLARRDFTMNALAYNPRTGVIDHFGGVSDLADGIVRCVGDPDRRFQEDGLRILRALRFAAAFDLQIAGRTAAAIHEHKDLLGAIAAERIQGELTKLLCGAGAARVLRDYADVIAVPIPEISNMFGFHQHNPHHDKDIWNHTLAVVDGSPADSILRWAALLHDIGKPACFSLGADGIGHFYGHAEESTARAASILSGLRMDAASLRQITTLIRYHDLPIAPEKKPIKRLMNKLGVETVRQLIDLHKADTMGQSAICTYRLAEYDQVGQVVDSILQEDACFSLKDLAVNGNDLIALGLRGPAIGAVLNKCLCAVMDERLPNQRGAILDFVRDWVLPSLNGGSA